MPNCTHLCPETCHPGECPNPEKCSKKVQNLIAIASLIKFKNNTISSISVVFCITFLDTAN